MPAAAFDSQYVYLTTTGRKTRLPRQIEIWFVERDRRVYILAEHGAKAHWVRNVLANPAVTIKISDKTWTATGRVLDTDRDAELYTAVRELARTKYGWGDGLPVEFYLEQEITE